jgi:hypothetical protein
MSEYKFGLCKICHKWAALCNDICLPCSNTLDLPDFMKDLFNFDQNRSNNEKE